MIERVSHRVSQSFSQSSQRNTAMCDSVSIPCETLWEEFFRLRIAEILFYKCLLCHHLLSLKFLISASEWHPYKSTLLLQQNTTLLQNWTYEWAWIYRFSGFLMLLKISFSDRRCPRVFTRAAKSESFIVDRSCAISVRIVAQWSCTGQGTAFPQLGKPRKHSVKIWSPSIDRTKSISKIASGLRASIMPPFGPRYELIIPSCVRVCRIFVRKWNEISKVSEMCRIDINWFPSTDAI